MISGGCPDPLQLQPSLVVYRAQPIPFSSSLCISNRAPPPPSLSRPSSLLQHPLICPTVISLAGLDYQHLTGEEYGNIVQIRRKLVEETCCAGFMVVPLWSRISGLSCGMYDTHFFFTHIDSLLNGLDIASDNEVDWIAGTSEFSINQDCISQ